MQLFSGQPMYDVFCRMQDFVSTRTLPPSARPQPFANGEPLNLPTTFEVAGQLRSLHALLGATHTAALLVLQDGRVRFEQYWLSGGPEVPWMSFSVGKSFTSALIGLALAEGAVGSLADKVTDYVPALAGTAYDGVSIEQVLQMSSGVRFYEDYSHPEDIGRLVAPMGGEGEFDAVVASLTRERPPGELCRYSSCETQALGMVLSAATGTTLADYLDRRLRQPLGATSPGYVIHDRAGRDMAFGGLLFTARDFARLGELYRNDGVWQGERLLSADFVRASTRVMAPHLAPGAPLLAGHQMPLGYGYQWWLPEGEGGEFTAIGVYNQFIYVDPSRRSVVVKLSANPAYGLGDDEALNKDLENLAAIRAINACLD